MSSYVEYHVLRLPISKTSLKDKEFDLFDLEKILEEKKLLKQVDDKKGFEIQYTVSENCIDYVLRYKYFSEGEFGFVRELTDSEKEKAKELFDKLDIKYNIDDVRYVHYCYYNCSEPPFYYECEDEDIFNL